MNFENFGFGSLNEGNDFKEFVFLWSYFKVGPRIQL